MPLPWQLTETWHLLALPSLSYPWGSNSRWPEDGLTKEGIGDRGIPVEDVLVALTQWGRQGGEGNRETGLVLSLVCG